MPSYREAVVAELLSERPGITRVGLVDGGRAYAITQLTGSVALGDRVIVNTTAVDLGLGSGGWHVVHWNLTAGPWSAPGPGHLMKLRYTSLQVDTGAAEEHAVVAPDLAGTPVVVSGVHSQLPAIALAISLARPDTRVAFVMTDGAALPIALSDTVAALTDRGLLCGTVTAGHAFGGDHEALNVPSALAAARHLLDAEIIVVGMGPGIAGTASPLGFTGLEAAPALDAAAWLGGVAIACLRCSEGDERPRHQGISHHSATVLDAVRTDVLVAIPPGVEPISSRHRWVRTDPGDMVGALADAGLDVTTMGRAPAQDRLYFQAAGAAGALAVSCLDAAPLELVAPAAP